MNGFVIIITGGAGGIGAGVGQSFFQKGASVLLCDSNTQAGNQVLTTCKAAKSETGGDIEFIAYDATSSKSAEAVANFAITKWGKIDALFNNVGVQPLSLQVPLHELDEAVWDQVMSVNAKSYFLMCTHFVKQAVHKNSAVRDQADSLGKYVLPHMLKQGKGSIINNASVQGIRGQKMASAYAASKGAILAFTTTLAVEYGPSNIRVNSISPGTIVTPMSAANTDFTHAINNTPLGRLGAPEDVAELVSFLSGDQSKHITGQNFVLDGGITIVGGWSPVK